MHIAKSEAAALSRLFSAAVMRDFAKQGNSPLFTRLLSNTRLRSKLQPEQSVGDKLDEAFALLSRSQVRDDYVYRSAICQKILLGRHNLNTATLLNEVRTGTSRADLVVLNGTATAYEIKSERDTLARLQQQIENYSRVFAKVNVVVSESHLSEAIEAVPKEVGMLVLSNRFTLKVIREAEDQANNIDPQMLLDILRIDEAAEVLNRIGVDVPVLPNTQIRSKLSEVFATLDPAKAHQHMVEVLRTHRSQANLAPFISSLPTSIRTAALVSKPNAKNRVFIRQAVDTPVSEALAWK